MRKEEFFEILGELDNDVIQGANAPAEKKANWKVWGGMAACLCFLVAGALVVSKTDAEPDVRVDSSQPSGNTGTNIAQSDDRPEVSMPDLEIYMPAKTDFLVVNELDSMFMADMDVQYSFYGKMPYHAWETILDNFRDFTGISYEDFIARVPGTWEYANFYSLAIRGYKDVNLSDEYRLHDYVFDFRTADGGEARIALCSLEEPLRDYLIGCDDPAQSEINGVPVFIYRFDDIFMAEFSFEKVNYDIETRGIELEELEKLLSGLLAVSESVPDN